MADIATQGVKADVEDVTISLATPRKVLYFSDGVEQQFDEEDSPQQESAQAAPVDPRSLSWMPWLSHQAWRSGEKIVGALDYAGEGLANFMGITTPKYQIEIDQHEQIEEEKKKREEEMGGGGGWSTTLAGGDTLLVTRPPVSVSREARV